MPTDQDPQESTSLGNSDDAQRFHKGLRQIRYEKHLGESQEWSSELTDPTRQKVTNIIPFYRRRSVALAAAGILLLLSSFLLWSFFQGRSSDRQLAMSYYEVPEVLSSRGSQNHTTTLSAALNDYNNQRYPTAKAVFMSIPETAPDYQAAQFFLALLQLKDSNTQAAINGLTALKSQRFDLSYIVLGPPETAHFINTDDIDWFLALSYLTNGEPNKSSPLLRRLSNTENAWRDRASELLKKTF